MACIGPVKRYFGAAHGFTHGGLQGHLSGVAIVGLVFNCGGGGGESVQKHSLSLFLLLISLTHTHTRYRS